MALEHDPDRVTRIVSEIRRALSRLEAYGKMPADAFLEDGEKVGNSKYQLIVAIEGSLDLANHLISRNQLRMPEDYADTFQVLGDENIINDAFATRLGEMARFRNRLVHIYWDIDDEAVHAYLQDDIGDIRTFVEHLLGHLEDA